MFQKSDLIPATLFLAALILAGLGQAQGAETYEEVLSQAVVSTMASSDPAIPDRVEEAYWTCWTGAFIDTQIGSEDLAKLDKLAAAGKSGDPLAVKWRERVDAALLNPDSLANREIDGRMDTLCPNTLDELLSY